MPFKPQDEVDWDKCIEALLADEQYLGHPLREALARVWTHTREQLARLERITQISDRYQNMAQERARSLSERYDRQLRQIEKVIRISDHYQSMLQDLNRALKEASTHDHLTGLPNRRLIAERLREEDERVARLGTPYALAVIDADRFKHINDHYGHDVGDRMLVELARTLKDSLREYDVCSRWGGEEFLALLVDTDIEAAQVIAERILQNVRRLRVEAGDSPLQITVSIGLAEYRAGETYSETIGRGDTALREAKNSGRDRCVVSRAAPAG